MVAAYALAAAVVLIVWVIALIGFLYTERTQRWHAHLFRRFPLLCWPFPPVIIERYFLSRYCYFQIKSVALVAVLMSSVVALAVFARWL